MTMTAFSIVLHGSATFKSLAMQNFNAVFKYLDSMTKYRFDLFLLDSPSTETIVGESHSAQGYYFDFEAGLNSDIAIINRFKLGQNNFAVKRCNMENIRNVTSNTVYVICQSDFSSDLMLLRPSLLSTSYQTRNSRYVTLYNDRIEVCDCESINLTPSVLKPENSAIGLTVAAKLIERATSKGEILSPIHLPIPA